MSGFEYTFVSHVSDEYICPICQCPMRKPVQTRCGHRFCAHCLEQAMKRSQNCPIDQGLLDKNCPTDIYADLASERTILNYQVQCSNQSNSCEWIGELRDVESHEEVCSFGSMACPNEDCDVTFLRKDLEHHVTRGCPRRQVTCCHCEKSYPWYLQQDHFNICSRYPYPCPQKCGLNDIPRNEISDHIENVCPLTEVECTFAHVGCQEKCQRKALSHHVIVSIAFHLNLAGKILQELLAERDTTKLQLQELQAARDTTKLQLEELEVARDTTKLQLEELEAACDTTKTELHDLQTERDSTKKDLQLLQTQVDSLQQTNGCNTFVWKFTEFDDCLQKAKAGVKTVFFSESFYTEPYGYRMFLSIFPNGDVGTDNTHLSVYMQLERGEFDAMLPWPFKQKVTFTLVDQQEEVSKRVSEQSVIDPGHETDAWECFEKPSEEANTGYGFPEFISHDDLRKRRYVVDDTLFLHVEIDPLKNVKV